MKQAGPHALRLDHSLQISIRALHKAGPRGLPARLANDVAVMEAWGIGEYFTDYSRIWVSRIRITPWGERIATTLLDQPMKERAP